MGTRELVDAAARLLDDRLPGWEKNVDLRQLDMQHPTYCVLGHQPRPGQGRCVAGNYNHATNLLGVRLATHPLHGTFGYGRGEDGVDLETCWRHEIELRRLSEAQSPDQKPQYEEVLQCATS